LLRFARNDVERATHTSLSSPRMRGSSTLRLLGSITGVSGILGRPHSRVTTTEYDFAISRHELSEVCWKTSRPLVQRAQGRPGARCTRGLACICTQRMRTRAYRFSGNTPAFPAQWLYGLLRALPGERLSCHHRPRKLAFANLAPAPRRQDHTTSPYASGAYVYRTACVHRISPHVRDDRKRPSSAVRRAESCR
jgi:hypothetical protein